MAEKYYSLDCGGLSFSYSPLYQETLRYFAKYITKCSEETCGSIIRITPEYMRENRWLVDEKEEYQPFIEFQCLMLATGNTLLAHNRALFHGAAFIWNGKAWIITAPSGIGKTTQLRHLCTCFPGEVEVLNGDKPFLECREDRSVWVHSSPWRGKEKLGKPDLHAPLGGIILLERGDCNEIIRLSAEEAVRPLFVEFVSFPECEEQIKGQAQILRQILNSVPVWKLVNVGDEDSARITLQNLESYLEGCKDA